MLEGDRYEREAPRPGRGRGIIGGSPLRRLLLVAVVLAAVGASAVAALASGGAPTVETEHASQVGRTSALLKANVNPNGVNVSECYFEYGTSESSLTDTAPCSYLPGELETPVPVSAQVEGLSETTTYYFRIHAKSSAGESAGVTRQLTTLPTAPGAENEPPASVGRTSATITAGVDPNDSEVTECTFEYGTSPSELTSHEPCSPSPGAGSEPVIVHAPLSGLTESTTYYFRVVATNAFGTSHSGRGSFETLPAVPRAKTEPAVSITHTSATLQGFVTPNGGTVEACAFEWGTSSVEEHTIPCEQTEIGSGEAPVPVTAVLSGLPESTTVHFRVTARNSHGTGDGGTSQFTTLPFIAKTNIQHPGELSGETALLRARIDPQGQAITECTFEYGTTPALGRKASCNTLPPAGERYSPVSAAVSGLTPSTTYLVRIKAVNASGAQYSKEETFTTFEAGLLPVVKKVKPGKGSSGGGNDVTISGEDLLHAVSVAFGEAETTNIVSDAADSLTVVAPPGVGTVDVVVTTTSGGSAIVAGDHYTYGKPIITGVSPNHGSTAGGTAVTVTGYGFEPGNGGTTFAFGKGQATSVECSSSSTCTMITPAANKGRAGTVKVQAKVNGKGSSAAPEATFRYET